jgi:hypothetical protein
MPQNQNRKRLEEALIAADAAGDVEAATVLANEIRKMDAAAKPSAQSQKKGRRGSIADPLAQGATLGFADELVGAIGATVGAFDPRLRGTTFGERYTGIRDQARQQKGEFEERNPKTALAAEIGGGIMTGGLGAKRAVGTQVAKSLPKLVGVGAGTGAAAGLGYSDADTVGGLAADTATGAAVGGVVGGLLPPVAKAVGRGVTAPFRHAAASRAAKPVAKLGQAIARDDSTPERVAATLRKLPAGATIADAGGKNVQDLARDVAVQPGKARNIAKALFEGRRKLAPQRIDAAVRSALGQKGEFHAAKKALADRMKTEAAPLYEAAYKQPLRLTPKLKAVMNRPSMKDALRSGVRMAKEEGDVIGGNIQMLDYAKRALDDKIGVALRAGENQKARALMGTKRALLDELDYQIPIYAKARAAFAGPKALDDALDMGRKFMTEDAEDIASMIADMTVSEKEFFRIGAIRQIRDSVLSKSDTADAYKAIFNSPLKREKIGALFPDAKTFAQFDRAMRGEATMFATGSNVMANSNTANKLSGVDDLALDAGTLVDAASGNWVSGGLNLVKSWLRKNAPAIKNEKTRDEIAELLFKGNRAEQMAVLKRIGVPVTSKAFNDLPYQAPSVFAGSNLAVSQSN